MPGRVLLRFGTTFGNIGAGPLVLTADPTKVNADGTEPVKQSLFRFDSASNKYVQVGERLAGDFIYHPEHQHFHFDGYASYQLFRSRRGKPYRLAKRSDGTQVVGDKVSFCLSDSITSFQIPGTTKTSRKLPGYTASGQPMVGCGLAQGLHVGMADSYDASIEGQWVDVTGVAAGDYFLIVKLDADGVIEESNETNNDVVVPVTLRSTKPSQPNSIAPDRFDTNTPSGERNDTLEDATDLGVQGTSTIAGLTLDSSVDQDWFTFKAAASGRFSVQTITTGAEADLYVYDGQGHHLVQSTDPQTGSPLHPATQTVNALFTAGEHYYVQVKGYVGDGDNGTSSDYGLKLSLPSRVRIAAGRTIADRKSGHWASVTLTRMGPVDEPLVVRYTITGSAVSGVDYEPLSGVVRFGDLTAARTIHITPIQGSESEDAKSLFITILDGSGYLVDRKRKNVTLQII